MKIEDIKIILEKSLVKIEEEQSKITRALLDILAKINDIQKEMDDFDKRMEEEEIVVDMNKVSDAVLNARNLETLAKYERSCIDQERCVETEYGYLLKFVALSNAKPKERMEALGDSFFQFYLKNYNDIYGKLNEVAKNLGFPMTLTRKDFERLYEKYKKLMIILMGNVDSLDDGLKFDDPIIVCKLATECINTPDIYGKNMVQTVKIYKDLVKTCLQNINKWRTLIEEEMEEIKKREIDNAVKAKYKEKDKFILELEKLRTAAIKHKSNDDALRNLNGQINEYLDTADEDLLVSICEELLKRGIITNRTFKSILYKKVEKVPEESKEIIEESNEEPEKEVKEEKNELDTEYFKRSSTKCLICFLGNNGNDIMSDLDRHFDNADKKVVLDELLSLFNGLYSDENFSPLTGGNPASKAARRLLEFPYKFSYKRYGISKDVYRLHAIKRHSSLLKELGYGNGDIIFFGALGVNDDKLKTDAYNRIAGRVFASVDNRIVLRDEFDYIEHITRGFIPSELLSEEDEKRKKLGQFHGKLKGTSQDKSIENGKYILFEALGDASKENIIKYLNGYFYDQTTKIFDIKRLKEQLDKDGILGD